MYISKGEKTIHRSFEPGIEARKKGYLGPAEKKEEKKERQTEKAIERETEKRQIVDPNSVLYRWRTREHEIYEKDRKWYVVVGLVLAGVVLYAILTDGLVMAITFILIGVVGYIILNKKPRIVNFYITDDGVVADKEMFEFEDIKSFWIFYEPEGLRAISLHTKSKFLPYVHIPLGEEDPTVIREILLKYAIEEKQKPNIVDTFERMLGI